MTRQQTTRAREKARKIQLLLLDVDGVMTDAGIYYSAEGVELKRFNAHDGYGIQLAREQGLRIGIISGRSTPIVATRARLLHIKDVYQGVDDKVGAMRELQRKYKMETSEIAYMGDDLFDLPLLQSVGLSAAPQNGRAQVRHVVDLVTAARGGDGAVREFIEFILNARNGGVKRPGPPPRSPRGKRR